MSGAEVRPLSTARFAKLLAELRAGDPELFRSYLEVINAVCEGLNARVRRGRDNGQGSTKKNPKATRRRPHGS